MIQHEYPPRFWRNDNTGKKALVYTPEPSSSSRYILQSPTYLCGQLFQMIVCSLAILVIAPNLLITISVRRIFICLHLSLYDWPRRLSCREIKMHAGMGRFNLESLKYLRICGIWQHSFTIDKRRN